MVRAVRFLPTETIDERNLIRSSGKLAGMMKRPNCIKRPPYPWIGACSTALFAVPAAAYVGPGAGLSVIGVLVALVGAVFLAIVGFLWYPIKRLLRARKQKATKVTSGTEEEDVSVGSG